MIDGDPKDFIDGLHYGDERWFVFRGTRYFIQGTGSRKDNDMMLELWAWQEDPSGEHAIQFYAKDGKYPVKDFENAKIFDGKSFWEIEHEIQWMDEPM